MIKELVISIVIVICIVSGNVITQNYTKKAVEETTQSLQELREEMINEDIEKEKASEKIELIHHNWDNYYEKLAYYIEHNELEKVETQLTGIKGYIEKEEYTEAIPELDKGVYILYHIKDKNAVNLKNIF